MYSVLKKGALGSFNGLFQAAYTSSFSNQQTENWEVIKLSTPVNNFKHFKINLNIQTMEVNYSLRRENMNVYLCSIIESFCTAFHSSGNDLLDSFATSIAMIRNLSLCTVFWYPGNRVKTGGNHSILPFQHTLILNLTFDIIKYLTNMKVLAPILWLKILFNYHLNGVKIGFTLAVVFTCR